MSLHSFHLLGTAALAIFVIGGSALSQPIDRQALVTRHNPVLRTFDPESPLSVGNGQFAFTVDVTGLQTFPEAFDRTIPLGTLSQWGWHSAPNPAGWQATEKSGGGPEVVGGVGVSLPHAQQANSARQAAKRWAMQTSCQNSLGRRESAARNGSAQGPGALYARGSHDRSASRPARGHA